MDGLIVDILGNRAILSNLDAFGANIEAKAQQLLEDAATYGLQLAEERVPVQTGFLRSRLYVEVEKGQAKIGDDAEYALPVELGHVTASGSFVPAQPYLVPSWLDAGEWLKEKAQGILGS